MKNTTTDQGVSTTRFLARFGGRFLCRSPPDLGGRSRRARDELSRLARSTKALCRRVVRQVLALTFCLIVAAIILTDPLCSAFLAAGLRLRRTRPERTAAPIAMVAASPTVSQTSP